ncbi:MAG: hypothetical protein H7062_14290 [Candidatus Saccharimonas sp.]|nr:hypothetical protein [Planctomycetaceae bacterium]
MVFTAVALVSSTANAQFLSERLVPPQQITMPTLPMTAQPAPARTFGAEKVRSHLWSLPFSAFPGAPTTLTHERLPADWRRPVLDVPTLASDSDPLRPVFPQQPVASRAYVSSPNPLQTPALARFPLPTEPAVKLVDDPGSDSAHRLLTSAVPLATPNPATFLRLSIPDPFEQLRVIRLANPPADSDGPDASQERPPLPKLSDVAPPK